MLPQRSVALVSVCGQPPAHAVHLLACPEPSDPPERVKHFLSLSAPAPPRPFLCILYYTLGWGWGCGSVSRGPHCGPLAFALQASVFSSGKWA